MSSSNIWIKTLEQYWEWCSPYKNLLNCSMKCLFIINKDDPIISFTETEKYIKNLKNINHNINAIILDSGGHCSSIEQLPNNVSHLDNLIIKSLKLS